MTRALLTAAAIGTLAGLALTFGPHGAIGIAVCAAGVIAWCLAVAVRRDMRSERDKEYHPASYHAQRRARSEAIERGKPPTPTCTYPFCSLSMHFCPATQSKVNIR